ncbi:triacylglycerol lipase [Malassezia caprae]|uniref:V-type proton ATPase subunit G n=1 Tax=Malassezia caprae TaxID=1381934 RepID=A0AAF0EDB2_9BASI|nr:triacylglycerol lipase [Malassezia caprae]
MVAQKSQGIQTLLEAEKEASKIVEQARSYRSQKLKEAQSEAEKEIADIKAQKQKELEEFQKKYEGTQSSSQDKIDRDTKDRLQEIEQAFEKKRTELVKKLIERVGQVDPQPHRNLHKIEA